MDDKTTETLRKAPLIQHFKLTHLITSGVMILIIVSILAGYHYAIQMQTQYKMLQKELQNVQKFLVQQTAYTKINQAALDDLSKHLGQDKNGLLLAETEYFLRTAVASLYVQHDIQTTITLLTDASARLKQLAPKYHRIHQLLDQNLSDLKKLPKFDLLDIVSRLQAIDNQIEVLPLVDAPINANKLSDQPTTKSESGWKNTLKICWLHIQKVLIIRHDEIAAVPLLSAEQRGLLNLHLHLLLSQTQSALLQRQASIYQYSLKQLQKTIKQYFSMESEDIKQIYSELTELQKINIAPELPDIYGTLKAIQQTRLYNTAEQLT
jgi:uroporphyrin-3 C-methyltransferase